MKQKIALLLTVIMTATSMPLGITAADTAPEAQVPVQAETRDGEVTTEDDQDGYSSVTIG